MERKPLEPQQLRSAVAALERVKSIDEAVARLQARNQLANLGEIARQELGRNVITQLTHRKIGELIVKAIIAALLEERDKCVDGFGDVVLFPAPPVLFEVREATDA